MSARAGVFLLMVAVFAVAGFAQSNGPLQPVVWGTTIQGVVIGAVVGLIVAARIRP